MVICFYSASTTYLSFYPKALACAIHEQSRSALRAAPPHVLGSCVSRRLSACAVESHFLPHLLLGGRRLGLSGVIYGRGEEGREDHVCGSAHEADGLNGLTDGL